MQIQPQSSVNFNGISSFSTPQKKASIISKLAQQGISYKVVDNFVYSGKDLTKFVKEEAYKMELDKFEAGVIRNIRAFYLAKAQKAAKLDELVNGKRVGPQGFRLKLKNKA